MAKVDVVVELTKEEVVTALTNAAKEAGGVRMGGSSVEYIYNRVTAGTTPDGNPELIGVRVKFGKQNHQPIGGAPKKGEREKGEVPDTDIEG